MVRKEPRVLLETTGPGDFLVQLDQQEALGSVVIRERPALKGPLDVEEREQWPELLGSLVQPVQ